MNESKRRLEVTRRRCGRPSFTSVCAFLVAAAVELGMSNVASATTFMPTGNSITEGIGSTSGLGFRDLLYTSLNTIGTFDFVGAPDAPNGAPPYEGHYYGGAMIADFAAGAIHDVATTMNAELPEMVAIHLGTNDLNSGPGPYGPWSNDHSTPNTSTTAGELGALVDYVLSFGSVNQVVLSRIIPIQFRGADVQTFNREVVRMVLDYRNGAVTGSPEPVYLADHYLRFQSNPLLFSGLIPGDWMSDALHPNDDGYAEMEDIYFEAVNELLNDATPPAPVADLAIGTLSNGSILLMWTNTGDDGSIGDPRYADCRYATGPIGAANFRTQSQAGDYEGVGSGGQLAALRVSGLASSTSYTFAMKLMDDAANLSSISNTVNSATLADADIYRDEFNRPIADPGPDWASSDFAVIGNELENTAGGFRTAIFTAVSDPVSIGFAWGAGADAAGIQQAGIACRLEGTDPATVDGYIAYRNTSTATLTLREVIDGVPAVTVLDNVPASQPAPAAGDVMEVVLSSDAGGHRFAVYLNGALDGVLVDPAFLRGNGTTWAGVITDGSFSNPIDDFEVGTASANLPPAAFSLLEPPDGAAIPHLHPILDWEDAIDPNGDPVTYDLYLSTDPGFAAGATTIFGPLSASTRAFGVPLAAATTYFWKVKAEDSFGLSRFSDETWSFDTGDFQQVLDDFERPALGVDWAADPSYSIAGGELACTAPDFNDIAVYTVAENPVAVEWEWSENATTPAAGVAGCLVGMNSPSTTASGYFVFRNTGGAQRWSVFEIVNGQLGSTLNIDQDGVNPLPGPGDRMRVVFIKEPTAHRFDCYWNDQLDARMVDNQRRQGTAPTTYAGLLLGSNTDNNVESVTIMGPGLNLPPAPFSLLEPENGSVVFSLAPTMRWEPALDPNPGDLVTYTVIYDLDPGFTNPDTLPPVTVPQTTFRGSLEFNETYYWKVRATDTGGIEVMSNETWSFITAPVLSVVDDFNRAELGPDWSGDTDVMQIVADELANTSGSESFDLAIYNPVANPDAVRITWSPSANSDGIRRGGLLLMLDGTSSTASGYWVVVDPVLAESRLLEITQGGIGTRFDLQSNPGVVPGPGSTFKIELYSDAGGHHFDVLIDDQFHSTLTDPAKTYGNGPAAYAGVALRGQNANRCDNFTLSAFPAAPSDFALLEPAHADTGVAYQPTFVWESAGPGIVYTLYVGSDSTFASADSVIAIVDTTTVWPTPLAHDTEYFWRVRATDGHSPIFNLNGWHAFTTTVVAAVELAGFEAEEEVGRVVLRWRVARRHDHAGFHVWRAAAAAGPYARLTGPEMVTGEGPHRYVDPAVVPGQTYHYRLEAVDTRGQSQWFGPVAATPLAQPLELALHPNRPNPFNPSTIIGFDLPNRERVELAIFDLTGRQVASLVSEVLDPGRHTVTWDGRTADGTVARSGAYFARLSVGEWSRTRKLLLVR